MSPDPCPAARAVPASSGPLRNSALQGLATPLSEKSASPRASSVLFLLPNPNLSTLQAFPCFLLVGAPIDCQVGLFSPGLSLRPPCVINQVLAQLFSAVSLRKIDLHQGAPNHNDRSLHPLSGHASRAVIPSGARHLLAGGWRKPG